MTSIAERIRAKAEKARQRRVLLPVPTSDVTVVCRTLTQDEITSCSDQGERIGRKNKAKVSRIVSRALIATGALEIWDGDEVWTDASGRPLTFDDDEVQAAFEVADRLDAVQAAIGRDGDIDAMAKALIQESGFNDDYKAGDLPT